MNYEKIATQVAKEIKDGKELSDIAINAKEFMRVFIVNKYEKFVDNFCEEIKKEFHTQFDEYLTKKEQERGFGDYFGVPIKLYSHKEEKLKAEDCVINKKDINKFRKKFTNILMEKSSKWEQDIKHNFLEIVRKYIGDEDINLSFIRKLSNITLFNKEFPDIYKNLSEEYIGDRDLEDVKMSMKMYKTCNLGIYMKMSDIYVDNLRQELKDLNAIKKLIAK